MSRRRAARKNRILITLGAVFCIVLSLVSIRSAFVSTVALEQAARCGAVEHRHSVACYEDKQLCCGLTEHSHNRNCYLVLLQDNDINSLLSHIGDDQSHSLEKLIFQTVGTAIQYNENLYTVDREGDIGNDTIFVNTGTNTAPTNPASSTQGTSSVDISKLNETISENNIEPGIVLNENLYNAVADSSDPGDTMVLLNPTGSGGVSTLAVGDQSVDTANNANIYINLDSQDNWVCIGTIPLEVTGNRNPYTARVNSADVTALIQNTLEPDNFTYKLRYATSPTARDRDWKDTATAGSYITLGTSYNKSSTAAQAKYIRIVANNYLNTAIRFYTVTYKYADGSTGNVYIQSGQSVTLPQGTWTANGGTYNGGQAVQITAATTFTEISSNYTVTYLYPDGTTHTETVERGKQIELPEGYRWTANGQNYNGGDRVTINSNTTFTGTVLYTVTYQYPNGTSSTETVAAGTQVTLPTGYTWTANSITYDGGTSVTISGNTTFVGTRLVVSEDIRVSYSVNFPMNGYSFSNMTVTRPASSPNVEGMSGANGSVTVQPEQGITVRTVSQTMVNLDTSHTKNYDYPVLFRGWMSETDELISAHSQLSWEELLGYDENNDGIVTLTGVWSHGLNTTANFFILLNSSTNQMSSSNPADYTDVIFSTYIGNANPNSVGNNPYNASSDAAALTNDAKIRAMHGEQADSMWFYTFPTDDAIFAALKEYAEGRELRVGTETVAVEDLNSNEYAIRWYKILSESDGWHVDGKLTRKVGVIEVSKTFSGNDTLIDDAKTNFHITATTGTRTVTLSSENTMDDGDGNANTWFWRIEGVKYNEQWTLTESPNSSEEVIHYAEWVVSDASANSQTSNGTGGQVTVRGVTYASDLADPEWLRVDYNNIYYHKDSLMIKKADGVTGEALSGATFRLYQNDIPMTFDFDSSRGMYVYNPSGTGTYDTLTGNGYMNIAARDFSYDTGPIIVREITAPSHYNPVGDIKVGYIDPEQMTIGIVDAVDYATYLDGLLVVYNSANTLNVTAEKIWECGENEWQNITVQLFANGSANLASTLSGTQSAVANLTAGNDYSYTWTNLPIYAYGTRVEWSIKELQIGDEACKADYTFANWAVSYDAAVYDAYGNVTLAVHNTPSRPMLFLTKTNVAGTVQLSGATFSLVQVNADGTPVNGFVTRTATTNEQGLLIFDNLLYGARYRITEETAPSGYKLLTTPIYLTIVEGGTVVVDSHSHARADAVAYNVVVTNDSYPPLPETGGSGPGVFYGLGGAMMLLGACGYILLSKNKRRRGHSAP